eukprot:XP_014019045.1 PREDICTED: succinate receptor 1 isoform X2 [Salmo salar]
MVYNCTMLNDFLLEYYLTPAYALEFALGFPSNLLVVLGYVFCLPEWKSTNVYLFNLAVSDLIFLCTLPRLSYLYANAQSEDNVFGCIINRYILHTNLYSSILFMVWVSMDRFLLVRHPSRLHFLLTNKAALCLSLMTWVAVNMQVAPLMFYMVQDMQKGNWSLCKDFGSLGVMENLLGYSMGLTVTGYLLPLLGLGFFSYHINRLLRVQAEVIQGTRTSFRRPVRVVSAVAAMFLVLYLPYHLLRNVRIASRHPWAGLSDCHKIYIESAYILTRPVAFVHSVINPVFYFFMGDKFRDLLLAKIRSLVRQLEQMTGTAM